MVWVAGSDGVASVDAASLHESVTWPLRFPAGEIAVGEGSVWVTHLADDRVTKIDEMNGPTTAIEVGNAPLDLAVGEGGVWVTNSLDGTVSHIDPRTNRVLPIHVGSSPEGVAIGDGFVWVAVHAL
jgi:YVTN family beta-propeller protein